jgi:hypothetical protein
LIFVAPKSCRRPPMRRLFFQHFIPPERLARAKRHFFYRRSESLLDFPTCCSVLCDFQISTL